MNFVFHWIQWTWWPESGQGYAFDSSVLGGLSLLGILGVVWHRLNCGAPRCFRIGRHATADGLHHLCRHHHPDFVGKKRRGWLPKWFPGNVPHMTLTEIHERHHAAQRSR